MTDLPHFSPSGLLPSGDYPLSLEDLRTSTLALGPIDSLHPDWDKLWRLRLVDNLEILVNQLWSIGVDEIFIDGSFAEDKDHPNDIDGYFACDPKRFASGQLEAELNSIDPHACWTWDPAARRAARGSPKKKQLPMWHLYHVELYPHFTGLLAGRDAFGNPLEFPAFFRKCRRTGEAKGIVQIVR